MREIKLRAGDIIRINPMVFLNQEDIFITNETEHVETIIFYHNSLGEFAFEAHHLIYPISFVFNQRDRYPFDIIGNAHEAPELLEENE